MCFQGRFALWLLSHAFSVLLQIGYIPLPWTASFFKFDIPLKFQFSFILSLKDMAFESPLEFLLTFLRVGIDQF